MKSRQLNSLLSFQSRLSILVIGIAFSAGCGSASDAPDEVGGGNSAGGSPSAAAGTPGLAGAHSVAGAGPIAGSGGSGNSAGAGSFPFAGAGNHLGGSGGAIALGGAGGAAGGAAAGSGGAVAGSGGAHAGSGGAVGGSAGHGGQASGGSGGMAPTWTQIYTNFISNTQYASNCNGAACHNPGKQKGFDFSSKASGYSSVKPSTSQFVSVLSSGSMPQGKTKMPAADLAIIKAWVAAGAQNN